MSTLRLLIVAPDPLIRAGLAALLAEQELLNVVGQTGDPAEVGIYQADLILWDTGYELDLDVMEELAECDLPILALVDEGNAVNDLINGGIGGCLLRSADPDQISAAAQAVFHELVVFEPHFALPQAVEGPNLAELEQLEPLTERENEVLQLLADGMTNKAIAAELMISANTVKFHVASILSKLDAQSRTEAVSIASRIGLLMV